MPFFLAHEQSATSELTLSKFLLTWEWDIFVIPVLFLTSSLYVLGWWRLRKGGHTQLAHGWRLAAYLGGQFSLVVALLSGVDIYQSSLFFFHMIQHEILIMVAPVLLLLGNPLPVMLWGMPRAGRRFFARLLGRRAAFRSYLARMSSPGTAWLIFTATIWLWHDPGAYQAAIHHDLIHYAEHITFFLAAMLFWWHITAAAPRVHRRLGLGKRIGLIILALVPNQILSVGIAMSENLLYDHYDTVPRVMALAPLDDQVLGGVIMWIPGGMMYVAAIIVLLLSAGYVPKSRRE